MLILFGKFSRPYVYFLPTSILESRVDMRNLLEQVKKHSVIKNCSDLSLFHQIVIVISNFFDRFFKHIPIKGAYYAFHIDLSPINNFYIPAPLLRCYKLTLTPSAGEHVYCEGDLLLRVKGTFT